VKHRQQGRCVVTHRFRWVWIAPGILAALALSGGTVGAADKTNVDQATKRVVRGAKEVGRGHVGPGLKEMFAGVGHTVVEGAKFSGETVREFFAGKK
jgi:hypothetical protein